MRSEVFKVVSWYGLSNILVAIVFASGGIASESPVSTAATEQLLVRDPSISKLKPKQGKGGGYKLVYTLDAPLDTVWKFKTDFDNQFLLSNKFIASHRLISHKLNEVVTEDEYSNKPGVTFKWQTTLLPAQYLLKFVLLNPEECGEKYHFGYIQLEALDSRTRVTQVAYFDFFGVTFWINYPFRGGMTYFLKYTAEWEQQTVLALRSKYQE